MAITASDVLSPAGDIKGSVWFPAMSSGDVTELVEGFITDAYTKTDDDEAAELWVYYRAATDVADRVASEAASKTLQLVNQGSKSTTTLASQTQYWIDKASGYLARFEAAEEEDGEDDVDGWSVLTSLRHA